jgi:hypothetical protein
LIQEGINATNYTWITSFPLEHQVIIQIIDERMNNHSTNVLTIHDGSNHSCFINVQTLSSMASTRIVGSINFAGAKSESLSSTASIVAIGTGLILEDTSIAVATTVTTSLSFPHGSSPHQQARSAIITGSVFGAVCLFITTLILYKARRRRTYPRPGKAWAILDDEPTDTPPGTDQLALTIEPFMKTVARPESVALSVYRPGKTSRDDALSGRSSLATLGILGSVSVGSRAADSSLQELCLQDRMDALLAEMYRLRSALIRSGNPANAPPAYDGPDLH